MKKVLIASVMTMMALGSAAFAHDEATWDGLVKTKSKVFKDAWADPDVDFTSYNKVMIADTEFEFRAVKKTSKTMTSRGNTREFWISDENKERLIETVTTIFGEELAKSKNFEVVSEPGPDVLILKGSLLDIVSNTPPETTGRGEIFLNSVGEATLVIEASDSLSGEVIYRGVDRSEIKRPGDDMIRANRVTTWAEVRRWANRWATRLVKGLDSIH